MLTPGRKKTTMSEFWEVNQAYTTLIEQTLDGDKVCTRNSEVYRLPCHKTAVFCFDRTPLVSLRKTAWLNALREFQWMLSGSSFIRDLHASVHPWWKPWADKNTGEVLYNYSRQFRAFSGDCGQVDQIRLLVDGVRDHPNSRRNLITTWNAAEMASDQCPVTNCHNTVTQAFVDKHNRLHLKTYQRSVDVIVGLPCNWIQMWAFLQWLAFNTGREAGTLTWLGGDVHVYEQHTSLAEKICGAYYEKWAEKKGGELELRYRPVLDGLTMPSDETEYTFIAEDFVLAGEYDPIIKTRAEMVV